MQSADFNPTEQGTQSGPQAAALAKWLVKMADLKEQGLDDNAITASLANQGAPQPEEIVEAYYAAERAGILSDLIKNHSDQDQQTTPDLPETNMDPAAEQSPVQMPAPPAGVVGSLLRKWAMGDIDNDLGDARMDMWQPQQSVDTEYMADYLKRHGWTQQTMDQAYGYPIPVPDVGNQIVWVDPNGPDSDYHGYFHDIEDAYSKALESNRHVDNSFARPSKPDSEEVEEEYRNDQPRMRDLAQNGDMYDTLRQHGFEERSLSDVHPEAAYWMGDRKVWADPDGPDMDYPGYFEDPADALEHINGGGPYNMDVERGPHDHIRHDVPRSVENMGDLHDLTDDPYKFYNSRPSKPDPEKVEESEEKSESHEKSEHNPFAKRDDDKSDDKPESKSDDDSDDEPKEEKKSYIVEYNNLPSTDGSAESIRKRIAALDKFVFKTANMIRAGGIPLSEMFVIDKLNLDSRIEVGNLKQELRLATVRESAEYLSSRPRYRVGADIVDDNSMFGFQPTDNAWIADVANENPSNNVGDTSLDEMAGLFAIDIPDHSISDAGAVQNMAMAHIRKVVNGMPAQKQGEIVRDFLSKVEVRRRAEASVRAQQMKQASVEPKTVQYNDIEGLFL